ncbi:fumarylacetoacetate hydrolase family protein [Rhodococcus sp. JVH1]|uniref:fumarylacetoacetate hydrolase family protein n=1 Tax=Rhodococcus sp. JVH1 TaxID=745408 RepID=UPI000271F43D|nr:fumarylacetoacetate hydrolase family protein [Rhodococcus sp. JVH1]EJI97888.1 hydroxylase domain protein [Rhodococcus sp. JVH1]
MTTAASEWKLEVAAVIGGYGKDLTPEQAEPLIAGFCILHDWSARDLQKQEMTLWTGPVKGKDTAPHCTGAGLVPCGMAARARW